MFHSVSCIYFFLLDTKNLYTVLWFKGWLVDFVLRHSNPDRSLFLIQTFRIQLYGLKYNLVLWSFASHSAQCGVTTDHSTCCGYFVRNYHISFRLFALWNLSVPTLCLKDPRRGGWHNSAGPSSDSQVIWVARLSSNSKNREKWCLTTRNTFVRQ